MNRDLTEGELTELAAVQMVLRAVRNVRPYVKALTQAEPPTLQKALEVLGQAVAVEELCNLAQDSEAAGDEGGAEQGAEKPSGGEPEGEGDWDVYEADEGAGDAAGEEQSWSSPRGLCYNCSKKGHMARDCLEERKCYNCGEPGHIARDCTALPELV